MDVILRITGKQHESLKSHLYPGDGDEAVALAICGRGGGPLLHTLSTHQILMIPHAECVRKQGYLHWPTERILPLIQEAAKKGMAILKIHSHPGGYDRFSPTDDEADGELFASVHGWIDDDLPHASAVMLPDGRLFGRSISSDGAMKPLKIISVAGDDIRFWNYGKGRLYSSEATLRNEQTFGAGTINLVRNLTIAVVGCSGTGSIVIEQLVRLGVGKLVIVDPDIVEKKNLNRIFNTTIADATDKKPKVSVTCDAIKRIGLGTEVVALPVSLFDLNAIRQTIECDVLFGCMDSIDGRDLLNRIAAFYNIPYFDLGVRLDADGKGGIDQICGTVHYLQPDGSSLLSRGVYTPEDLAAAGLKRVNPTAYKGLLKEKYIRGVQVDRPAVISVNCLVAALAVNEFLARVHPFRDDPNGNFASFGISLSQARLVQSGDGLPCGVLSRFAGRGDMRPLLNMPELDSI